MKTISNSSLRAKLIEASNQLTDYMVDYYSLQVIGMWKPITRRLRTA